MKTRRNHPYANGHRRRQLRARLLRTTQVCEVCGEPLDARIPAGHPMAPEVDERIPRCAGGDPLDKHGTRLIHRHCNKTEYEQWRRGTKTHTPMPALESTRNW